MLQKWQSKQPSRRYSSQNSYLKSHFLENCINFPQSIMSLIYKFTYNAERKFVALLWTSKFQCVFFFSFSCLENWSQFACVFVPLLIAEPSMVDSLEYFVKAVSKDKHFVKLPRMRVFNLICPQQQCLLAGCSFIGRLKFQFSTS